MRLLIYTQVVDKNDPILGFFHRWVEEFAKHFERVDVICLKEGDHELPAHVHVHSLGKEEGENRLKYLWRFYRYFWKLYVRQDVDFVFYHMGAIYNILGKLFFLIRKFKKTKFIWWKAHGHINWIGRLALFFVDEIVTSTKSGFPINSRKRRVVGQAIDTDTFTHAIDGAKSDTILFVGRISRVKRVEQVISVLKKLREKDDRYTAKIIGPAADEAYYAELVQQVDVLGLTDAAEFVDGITQHELVREYQHASTLMNPSDTNSMDKVVLEAMACGAIPVTANVSFKDMLSPYGLYMEKGDIDGYAQCIERVTGMSKEERDAVRQELRDKIVEEHALKTLPKRIFNIG